jgi:hypothetical protein
VLVLRLAHEREPRARVERRVRDGFRAEGDTRDGDDADARVVACDGLAGRGVAQVVAGAPAVALEPEAQPLAQNSDRTASATRSGDGMYASSIAQYGYGTSYPVTRSTGPCRSKIAFSASSATSSAPNPTVRGAS